MSAPNFKSGTHTKVQRSGVAAGSAATIDASSSPAPAIGSRLVLRVGIYSRQGSTFTITDNQASGGNTWSIDVLSLFTVDANNKVIAAICTCEVTKTVSSPFTISVNVTSPGGTTFHGLVLDEVENYNATTFLEATGTNSSGTSNSAVGALADTSNDCLKLGVASWYGGADGSNGSGWTLDDGYTSNSIQAATCVSKSVTGADTTDPTISLTASDQWAAASIAIRGIGAAAVTIGSDAGSRRNRPGRGPYSRGRYFRATDWLGSFLVGAQTYSVSVAETGSAGDTVAAQVQLGASLTESGAAADVLSTVATFLRAVAESATASDSLSTTAVFPRSVTETGSASDIVSSGAATYSVDLAEIATAAETLAALLNAGAALTETAAATDTVASLATLLAALTESVSATDTQSSALGSGTYNVDLTEAAAALDSLATTAQWARDLAESGNATDTLAALGTFGALVAEAAAAVEVLAASGISNVTVTEAVSAADLVSAPTGFGETPEERVISVRYGNRVIHVGARSGPIRVLN